jgi:hypothetical protein
VSADVLVLVCKSLDEGEIIRLLNCCKKMVRLVQQNLELRKVLAMKKAVLMQKLLTRHARIISLPSKQWAKKRSSDLQGKSFQPFDYRKMQKRA